MLAPPMHAAPPPAAASPLTASAAAAPTGRSHTAPQAAFPTATSVQASCRLLALLPPQWRSSSGGVKPR